MLGRCLWVSSTPSSLIGCELRTHLAFSVGVGVGGRMLAVLSTAGLPLCVQEGVRRMTLAWPFEEHSRDFTVFLWNGRQHSCWIEVAAVAAR